MTIMHTSSGRQVDIDPSVLAEYNAGEAADLLAKGDEDGRGAAYGKDHPGEFSFKVDGVVLQRDARLSDHLEDDAVVELVDVTDYVWPDDNVAATGETPGPGTLVTGSAEGLHQDAAPLVLSVPAGTVDEIVAWVDGNALRAKAAREVENAKDDPRSTLVAQLDAIADAAAVDE